MPGAGTSAKLPRCAIAVTRKRDADQPDQNSPAELNCGQEDGRQLGHIAPLRGTRPGPVFLPLSTDHGSGPARGASHRRCETPGGSKRFRHGKHRSGESAGSPHPVLQALGRPGRQRRAALRRKRRSDQPRQRSLHRHRGVANRRPRRRGCARPGETEHASYEPSLAPDGVSLVASREEAVR